MPPSKYFRLADDAIASLVNDWDSDDGVSSDEDDLDELYGDEDFDLNDDDDENTDGELPVVTEKNRCDEKHTWTHWESFYCCIGEAHRCLQPFL